LNHIENIAINRTPNVNYYLCGPFGTSIHLGRQQNLVSLRLIFKTFMISVDAVTVEFNGSALFSDITFNINENDRIALMGKNGAGKSTLLKIIAGKNKPTRGKVSAPKDAIIAYLPQHLLTEDDCSVFEETSKAFSKIHGMKTRIDELNHQLETRTDYESDEYAKIIEEVSELSEKFYSIEEINYDAEIEKTLIGLGFVRSDFTRPTKEYSGGWRMRIELAKILLQKPDLILLDEPTNHLDIESVQWLEDFLKTGAKAVIVISHDKTFVDNLTNRTIEVTMGRIYDYKTNYSHYLQLRKERREQQQKHFDDQQKEIADITAFIERFKGTYSKTLQVQSRVKMLEKIEIVQVDEMDTSALNLKFPPAPRSGNYPVIADGLTKAYGDNLVFKDATFTIARGEKIAFVGKNGEGKSTMIKAIMGEIDFEGRLQVGHNSMIGYFAQNQAALLDGELTVFETIDQVAQGDIRTKIKDMLGAFMFSGENIDKKVKVLSGGEKTRLAMLKLLLQPVNLLILDEPTNHLDIKTKDILKDALLAFDGTLILVSHDRDFLDGLAQKVFEFGNKRVREHFEDINGFLRNKKMENLKEIERKV
jgi:ATP-binding cassette subfamily F protein 3